MEIIKHGDPDRVKQTKVFECTECGCVFKANMSEYRERYFSEITESPFRLVCNCPDCDSEAEEARISLNTDKQILQALSPCNRCFNSSRQTCCGCAEYND